MDKKKEPNVPERWHGAHHYSNKLNFFFVFFLVFAALTLLWFYFATNKIQEAANKTTPSITPTATKSAEKPQGPGVACTMEVKACPDGVNFAGRTAPNCDFQACPDEHCGGFIKNAKTCLSGYHCEINSRIPDLGGTCVKDTPTPTKTKASGEVSCDFARVCKDGTVVICQQCPEDK